LQQQGSGFSFPVTDRGGHDTEAEGQRKPGELFLRPRPAQHDLLPRIST